MRSFYESFIKKSFIRSILACTASAAIYAIALGLFVQPIGAFAGGVNGASQIIQQVVEKIGIGNIPLGVYTIALNIPILLFGWFKVDKKFTLLTIYTVVLLGILLNITVQYQGFINTDEVLVNIIFGGVLMGTAAGLALRYGGSLGGTDIVISYISQRTGKSLGGYAIIINCLIVVCAYFLHPDKIEIVLLTIILFFLTSLAMNQVHTKHKRFTAFIISSHAEEIVEEIHLRCGRGATILDAHGTYYKTDKDVIMTVITSYQMFIVKDIIARIDPRAFVDIVPTKEIYGNFIGKKTDAQIN